MVGKTTLVASLLLATSAAQAGQFAVTPIRLDFSPKAKSGALTVVNSDKVPLGFQTKLLKWSQDGSGSDVYEDSQDLVFFPRMLHIEPDARQVVRVGAKLMAAETERTYRLAIDEMAPPSRDPSGAQVAVQVRFAVPVFVAPAQPRISVELQNLALKGEELRYALVNTGNQHVKLDQARLVQGDKELSTGSGWYVLAGARREFSVKAAGLACGKNGAVVLELEGEGLGIKRDVSSLVRCGQ